MSKIPASTEPTATNPPPPDKQAEVTSTPATPTSSKPSQTMTSKGDGSSIRLNRKIVSDIWQLYKGQNEIVRGRVLRSSIAPASSLPPASSKGKGAPDPPSAKKHTSMLSLEAIATLIRQPIETQNTRATVMILGNVSAGKSTFINWYVGEFVQRTGMAAETTGMTFITAGRCVTEVSGEAALRSLRPQLLKIIDEKYPGSDFITVKTCPSRDGRLHLIDLVDTPGLTDSENSQLPFDIENVVYDLRNYVDLFFIFLDPVTQATERSTMSLVRRLNAVCPEKLRFCLSKVDEVYSEEDRIKVMCQTTQALSSYLNSKTTHAFDLIPFYVPGAKNNSYLNRGGAESGGNTNRVVNRIKDLVEDIENVIERKVQQSLNLLKGDLDRLGKTVDQLIEHEQGLRRRAKETSRASKRRTLYRGVLVVTALVLCCLQLIAQPRLFPAASDLLLLALSALPDDIRACITGAVSKVDLIAFRIAWALLVLALIPTISFRRAPKVEVATHEEVALLAESRDFLKCAKVKWNQLHRLYLDNILRDDENVSSTAASRASISSS